jgi:hypothetical protein
MAGSAFWPIKNVTWEPDDWHASQPATCSSSLMATCENRQLKSTPRNHAMLMTVPAGIPLHDPSNRGPKVIASDETVAGPALEAWARSILAGYSIFLTLLGAFKIRLHEFVLLTI